jgi:hypothetical protein
MSLKQTFLVVALAVGCNGVVPTTPAASKATAAAPISSATTTPAGTMPPTTTPTTTTPPTMTPPTTTPPTTTPAPAGVGGGTTTQTPGQETVDSSNATDPHMQYCLGIINQSRAQYGAPPVTLDVADGPCAAKHASDLWSCCGGNGANFATCMHQDFINGSTCTCNYETQGQASGDNDPAFLIIHQGMMAEGPPPAGQMNHFSTITDPALTTVAIAEYVDSQGQVWLSEEWK